MITQETNINDIYSGKPEALWQIYQDRLNRHINADLKRAQRISALYIKWGKVFVKRADIAFAQMTHETDFLTFTGDVKPNQNNFAGLGATGGVPGLSFKTEELGIIAHYAHLCWYLNANKVNEYCSDEYDPRHFGLNGGHPHTKFNGNTTLKRLGGAWAVPGLTYAKRIADIANDINKHNSNADENNGNNAADDDKDYDVIIQMGHVGIYKGMTGTNGEREWTNKVGKAMNVLLKESKLKYKIITGIAPDKPLKCTAFLSLHCDGAHSQKPNWFTMGFKPETDEKFKEELAQSWKKFCNFPRGNDNSTGGLRLYYMWTKKSEYSGSKFIEWRILAKYYCLLEHGFFTNPAERKWLEMNVDAISLHHFNFILKFFGINS